MLTKGQKAWMYVCGTLTIILAIFTFIPFRVLPFLNGGENVYFVEALLKFVIVPVIILGISVYQNIIKYQLIISNRERSKVINVMSYLPLTVYLIGLLLFVFHTLTFDLHPMSDTSFAALLTIIVIYFGLLVLALLNINKIAMTLKANASYAFDAAVFIISITFIILSWRINTTYGDAYRNVAGFAYTSANNDPYLFVILVLMVFATIFYVRGLIKLVKKDQMLIMTTVNGTEDYEEQSDSEYLRAYNDILDDFEKYWAEGEEASELEAIEEASEEEEKAEEAQEETPVEEEKAEEAQEETPAEEEKAEEVQEETPVEEEKVEEAQEETPAEEKEPDEIIERHASTETLNQIDEVLGREVEQIAELESIDQMILDHDNRTEETINKKIEEIEAQIEAESELLSKESIDSKEQIKLLQEKKAQLNTVVEKIIADKAKANKANNKAEEEKPVEKKKKVFKPTFESLVKLADSLKEDDWKINNRFDPETGRGTIKYSKGKQQFLILQATASEYRVTFLARDKKVNDYISATDISKTVKVSAPKKFMGLKWVYIVNKGVGDNKNDSKFIKGAVREALKGANEELDRIAKEKAAEKARKAAERKAAREAAKQAAKKAAQEAAQEN